jgi:hypothetical protein
MTKLGIRKAKSFFKKSQNWLADFLSIPFEDM